MSNIKSYLNIYIKSHHENIQQNVSMCIATWLWSHWTRNLQTMFYQHVQLNKLSLSLMRHMDLNKTKSLNEPVALNQVNYRNSPHTHFVISEHGLQYVCSHSRFTFVLHWVQTCSSETYVKFMSRGTNFFFFNWKLCALMKILPYQQSNWDTHLSVLCLDPFASFPQHITLTFFPLLSFFFCESN